MNALDWIISILLFIVSLGVLITIHELGHLAMAKAFKVYCHEFSIGFGPAIIHKRPKGKETYISLRAIPFGGFVAMYGEPGQELEPGLNIPPERSLEGIKKWKKLIIVSAGIILNVVLSITLMAISNIAFPLKKATLHTGVVENSVAYNAGIRENDELFFATAPKTEGDKTLYYQVVYYEYTNTSNNTVVMGYFGMVDNDIEINGIRYVLTYYPTGNKNNTKFTEGMKLYPANTVEEVKADADKTKAYQIWLDKGELSYYPDFKKSSYIPYDSTTVFTAKVPYVNSEKVAKAANIEFRTEAISGTDKYQFKDIGLELKVEKEWLPLGTRIKNTFLDFGEGSIAVFKGLGTIFTKGPQNASGIIGVFETSATIYSTYTFSYYFFFWGLISVNLAIFNLLPIPGLDGFTLLITIIEMITHKNVPNKVKSIITIVGYVLLFSLIITILAFDVLKIVGVM